MENSIKAKSRSSEIIAAEINTIKSRTRREMLAASIEIGERLTEAKELVNHGEWENWLETEVDYSQSTADNLMRIYKEYGDEQLDLTGKSKSQTFEKLSYSQAIALFALPASERADFVEKNDVEDMSSRQLADAIAAKKKAEEDKEAAENKAAGAVKLADNLKGKVQKLNDENNALNNKLNYQADTEKETEKQNAHQIDELMNRIKELSEAAKKAKTPSPEEIEKLRAEVKVKVEADYKKKTDQLTFEKQTAENEKAELKAKYEEKLKQLKLDNASILERQQKAEKALSLTAPEIQKISAYSENIQQNFNSILSAIQTLAEANSETADKLRGAIKCLLSKLSEEL